MKHEPDINKAISGLWNKVAENFATRDSVLRLIKEMQRLESNQESSSQLIANTAAAIVIKELTKDIEQLRDQVNSRIDTSIGFNIEICTNTDKHGRPVIKDPKYNTVYLTPAENPEENNYWDEWIAVPRSVGSLKIVAWEHLGAKTLNLSWVKQDFKTVNKALYELNDRLKKSNKATQKLIIENAIKPFEEFKNYVMSKDFIKYIYREIPRASLGQDGLMTSGAYALLQGLALWAGNDHRTLGGGALSAEYVIRAMEYYGIDCDDLKPKECGNKIIYPEFNFPKPKK